MAGRTRPRRELPRSQRINQRDEAFVPNATFANSVAEMILDHRVTIVLEGVVPHRTDAVRRCSIPLLLAAMVISHSQKDASKGAVIDYVRVINGLTDAQRDKLGAPNWQEHGGYDRAVRLFNKIAKLLREGTTWVDQHTGEIINVDTDWYVQRSITTADMRQLAAGCAAVIDGTAIETASRLHIDAASIPFDGEYRKDDKDAIKHQKIAKKKEERNVEKAKAKVFAVGPDGRKQYTLDPDARAGWRTATAAQTAGFYVGAELHLAVAVPPIEWTNGVDRITFGNDVPQFIVGASYTPAGTNRTDAVIPMIEELVGADLYTDGGADARYSLQPRFQALHKRLGVLLTFEPKSHQLGETGTVGPALIIDGHPFSRHLTDHNPQLVGLPKFSPGMPEKKKQKIIEKYNQRARLRYSTNGRPSDGAVQWISPFHTGKARCQQVPKSMRGSRSAPLVAISGEFLDTTFVSGADELLTTQPTIFGTTAFWKAYGRRNLTETANSQLKGRPIDLRRGFTRHTTRDKQALHIGAALLAHNLRIQRNWEADTETEPRKPRADRRTRYADLEIG